MRPAPPHFATCSTYKQHQQRMMEDGDQVGMVGSSANRNVKSSMGHNRGQNTRESPGSPAARPEVLGIVRSWYNDHHHHHHYHHHHHHHHQQQQQHQQTIDSPSSSIGGGICDRSSYPSSLSSSYPNRDSRLVIGRPNLSLYSVVGSRDRESSLESNEPLSGGHQRPRKAYMDLTDAIALLDETCPNPSSPPILTPRTPRTPLTPFPRGKRARSKSSDNSSNYSNELVPTGERPEMTRSQEKEAVKQRRPFLRKIGVSKTEDRPFLAKIAPRIIGKPYLEKIGPSRAVEKPFLEKIGSSKTLDRFTFETLRELPRVMTRRCQPSPLAIERTVEPEDEEEDVVLCIIEDERNDLPDDEDTTVRTNGKGYLLKMYSFEAEEPSQVVTNVHQDHGTSLDFPDSGPSSLPPSEDSHEPGSSRSDDRSASVAELVKCRVTTSEEIFTTISGHRVSSPREASSWNNSPSDWSRRRSRRIGPRGDQNASRVSASDESTPNSPTKRPISSGQEETTDRTIGSYRPPVDSLESPLKTRRQASVEEAASSDSRRDTSKSSRPSSEESQPQDETVDFARCKSRRQTFREAMEKFGGADYAKTRRQVSEEILDKKPSFEDANSRFERRGISSDNLKLSRETVVASVPSTSSLGYQSGDSSSQRSSYHSQQDFIRGTLKILHDKFELQEVPSESYAAFKRRTRANHLLRHKERHQYQRENTGPRAQEGSEGLGSESLGSPTNGQAQTTVESTDHADSTATASEEDSKSTARSVLRKQDGVDQQSDQEADGSSLRRPKRRMMNEPSQETMDLLSELRRVKSMLKTPSIETDGSNDLANPPIRYPKKILLTDREFCLSVERENSVRRRPSILPTDEGHPTPKVTPVNEEDPRPSEPRSSRRQRAVNRPGPALFEKRCLSLDYADDEKPPKPEARAISLVASSRTPRSGTVDYEILDSSDPVGLDYDARSYSSDVFTSPSDENEESRVTAEVVETGSSRPRSPPPDDGSDDVDIATPVDHAGSPSPKRRVHAQGRTSDLYEIMSPRSTPFRVKKRLGRISIEDRVKPENFTLSKLGTSAVASQKRTKCFPL